MDGGYQVPESEESRNLCRPGLIIRAIREPIPKQWLQGTALNPEPSALNPEP